MPARNRWNDVAAWGLPPLLVVATAWLVLGGWSWDIRMPLGFSGDALFYLAQSKATLDHGWWWTNPSLGAPVGYHPLAFAQNSNVDQAVVWAVGRFTHDVGPALNAAWLAMLALGAVTTTWGLRRLGLSRPAAGAAGVLFALSPFAMYRYIGHFNVVTYLVPLPATTALLLACSDRERRWRLRDMAVPIFGCALLGFNYIYFAFFGAFIVATGAIVGAARTRALAPLGWGALSVGVVALTASLNLVPSVLTWKAFGPPIGVEHRAAESEFYGLKIRHLVTPVDHHWFPPLEAWGDRDRQAGFANENENRLARLGVVATAGFLGLIGALIFPGAGRDDDSRRRVRAAAVLAVAMVLLGTIGGLGSLFSLLVSPDIRAYNRVSPFIAFFALAAVAMWIDRVTRTRSIRWQAGLVLGVLLVGIADQMPALRQRTADMPMIKEEVGRLSAFMSDLEARLPNNAMVYQFPVRPYPVDPGVERLGVYSLFKPYLTSHRLRWSYPALTRDQLLWERGVESVEENALPRYLARQGFSAILIARAAYPDQGRRLELAFQESQAGATLLAASDDYVALDLRSLEGPAGR